MDAGQAAGDQGAQEGQPAGAVLGGGPVQAEDVAVAVRVDADCDQCVDVDDAAALADLLGQGIDPDEGVGAASRGRLRNAATCSSRCLAIALTWDFDSWVTPRLSASFSTRRVETPSR